MIKDSGIFITPPPRAAWLPATIGLCSAILFVRARGAIADWYVMCIFTVFCMPLLPYITARKITGMGPRKG
eukprot:4689641-Prymnesium_polylepis.1